MNVANDLQYEVVTELRFRNLWKIKSSVCVLQNFFVQDIAN